MSEPKLYVETLCEHGRMESHGTMKGARGEDLSAPGHICEGGERYEVTVSHMLSAVRRGVESGEIEPPEDMARPMLVWIDYETAVYGDHEDGWLSVDGDAIRLRDTR